MLINSALLSSPESSPKFETPCLTTFWVSPPGSPPGIKSPYLPQIHYPLPSFLPKQNHLHRLLSQTPDVILNSFHSFYSQAASKRPWTLFTFLFLLPCPDRGIVLFFLDCCASLTARNHASGKGTESLRPYLTMPTLSKLSSTLAKLTDCRSSGFLLLLLLLPGTQLLRNAHSSSRSNSGRQGSRPRPQKTFTGTQLNNRAFSMLSGTQ